MKARLFSGLPALFCAWYLGFRMGTGAPWWAIALGALGVVVATASALVPWRKRPEPEVVEATTPTARKVLHGPIKVRVVTTTMRER